MILLVRGGLNQYIETLIYLHGHLSYVFTGVILKIRREGKLNILYQGSLEQNH